VKTVHVVPDLSPASGGQTTAVLGLCQALIGAGLEIDLFTTSYELNRLPHALSSRIHVAPCTISRWRWAPTAARTWRPVLAQAQLAHVHGLWLHPSLAAVRLCRMLGVPYVISPCGMLEAWSLSRRAWRKRLYAALVERHTLRAAAAIHFTSDGERERSSTLGSRAPACVVPLGVASSGLEGLPPRGAFRRAAGLGAGPVILFLGRLHAKKRPDLLLEAFPDVAVEHPDAHLVLAGPGEETYVSRLRERARVLKVDHRVIFPGLLHGRAVQEAFVDADVFALPSLQENFGLAVAEAMGAGCPVVVSPNVALAGDVQKHCAGLVAAVEREPLAQALRQLLRDRDRRVAMGQNGRRLVLEKYTWESAAQQMIEVYGDLVHGSRTSTAWR